MTFSKDTLATLKGSGLILISAIMFGSYGIFAKILSQYDVFFQTYVRCFLVMIVIGGYAIVTKQWKRIQREDYKWFATVLVFTSFSIAPITYAFRYLTLGNASFLFYSSVTICSYLFGFLYFKEKLTSVKVIALLLSIAGMLLIFSLNLTGVLLFPALMAILNGIASGGEVTFSKKISDRYSSVQITAMVFGIIAISHFFISIWLGERQDLRFVTESLPALLIFVGVAITGMITVVEGYKYVEPSIGAIIGLSEILFSVAVGLVLFHEQLTTNTILGGSLILIACTLPNLVELLSKKTT